MTAKALRHDWRQGLRHQSQPNTLPRRTPRLTFNGNPHGLGRPYPSSEPSKPHMSIADAFAQAGKTAGLQNIHGTMEFLQKFAPLNQMDTAHLAYGTPAPAQRAGRVR